MSVVSECACEWAACENGKREARDRGGRRDLFDDCYECMHEFVCIETGVSLPHWFRDCLHCLTIKIEVLEDLITPAAARRPFFFVHAPLHRHRPSRGPCGRLGLIKLMRWEQKHLKIWCILLQSRGSFPSEGHSLTRQVTDSIIFINIVAAGVGQWVLTSVTLSADGLHGLGGSDRSRYSPKSIKWHTSCQQALDSIGRAVQRSRESTIRKGGLTALGRGEERR